jgi:prepilin-type N-terminal cleavage/methylation domain-containing protein
MRSSSTTWMATRRKDEAGMTPIELMVVMAVLGIIISIAVPAVAGALARTHRSALLANGRVLHAAMTRYAIDQGEYPSTSTPPTQFMKDTLAPLPEAGLLPNPSGFLEKLQGGRVTAYDSPDLGGGVNREFWAVLTSSYDPALKLVVAMTTAYPGHGEPLDGLYWVVGGDLEKAR